MAFNKRSHIRPLRGLDLNRYAGFGLCCERYAIKTKEKKMKKAIIASVMLVTLAGCATTPSPWAGVPHQNINAWKSMGIQPAQARQYMSNGFEPLDAKPWVQMGIDNPTLAVQWHRAGFTPEQSKKWIAKGFTPEQATELKKKGLTVE